MTTFEDTPFRCPLCGEPGVRPEITSTNELEARDLDLRPGEMKRSTMPFWIVRCVACGYAFDPGEDPDPIEARELVEAIVRSPEYRTLLADESPMSDFALQGLIRERTGRPADAGWSYLRAAWLCDDRGDDAEAIRHRLRAAELWGAALAEGTEIHPSSGAEHALLADVLRRAGHFDRALAACESGLARDDLDEGIHPALVYTRVLIERRDRGRHTLDDVQRYRVDALKDLLGSVERDLAADGIVIDWEVEGER